MILVDSNVLIDIIESQARWVGWSSRALSEANTADTLAINIVVYAEIARTFESAILLDTFLSELGIRMEPIPAPAGFLASRAHRAYRAAGGARGATLPDFLIGAHALAMGWTLLTRDASRPRRHFPGVKLIAPDPAAPPPPAS